MVARWRRGGGDVVAIWWRVSGEVAAAWWRGDGRCSLGYDGLPPYLCFTVLTPCL